MIQGLMAISADEEACTDNYEILHTICEGRFIKVNLFWHFLTRTEVAVNVIKKNQQSSPGSRDFSRLSAV